MADRPRNSEGPRDLNQRAASTVARTIGEESKPEPELLEPADPTPEELHGAAIALGRSRGKRGGSARAKKMTAEQRSESARKAAQVRWGRRGEARGTSGEESRPS